MATNANRYGTPKEVRERLAGFMRAALPSLVRQAVEEKWDEPYEDIASTAAQIAADCDMALEDLIERLAREQEEEGEE